MIINIKNYNTNEIIASYKCNNNASTETKRKKFFESLQSIGINATKRMITGKIDTASGTDNLHYILLGNELKTREVIEEEEKS